MTPWLTRDEAARAFSLPDERLAALPEIDRFNEPQIWPQEYDCGCIAVLRVTHRDTRFDEKPFEMRLAVPCHQRRLFDHAAFAGLLCDVELASERAVRDSDEAIAWTDADRRESEVVQAQRDHEKLDAGEDGT